MIIVTGGAGFIGSNIVKGLNEPAEPALSAATLLKALTNADATISLSLITLPTW